MSRITFRSSLGLSLAASLGAVLATTEARSNSRSCDAGYVATNRADGSHFVFGEFVARGECGANGDTCRKKARKLAHDCMKTHWRDRWDRRRPPACRSSDVVEYRFDDLKGAIEAGACHRGWGRTATVTMRIEGHSKGKNDHCRGRSELTSSYEVTPEICAGIDSRPPERPSTSGAEALVIPANTRRDATSGLKFPASMPAIRYPKGFFGCSAGDKTKLRRAWAMAHYMVWTADRAMDWMERKGQYRKRAWDHTFRDPASNEHVNYAPRAWFGPMNDESFGEASGTIEKLWGKRFTGKTFTVMCRKSGSSGSHPCFTGNPGGNGRPTANHIVYGRVNFCAKFFDDRRTDFTRARTVVHELLHWLSTPRGHAVRDTHTHCHGVSRCTTDKGYGRAASHHLSNYDGGNRGTANAKKRRRVDHRKRALRNNDNYAWFIHDIGRAAYEKSWPPGLPRLTHFPAPGFRW